MKTFNVTLGNNQAFLLILESHQKLYGTDDGNFTVESDDKLEPMSRNFQDFRNL